MEMRASRAVIVIGRESQVAPSRILGPAMPGLEPKRKLEKAAAKRLEKLKFPELEWF